MPSEIEIAFSSFRDYLCYHFLQRNEDFSVPRRFKSNSAREAAVESSDAHIRYDKYSISEDGNNRTV